MGYEKFIKLTQCDGSRVLVNCSRISRVVDLKGHGPDGEMTGVRIDVVGDLDFDACEDFDTVVNLIDTRLRFGGVA